MIRTARMHRLSCWALVACTGFALATVSRVTLAAVDHIEVLDRKPYQGGKVFPGVGAYETIHGRAWFKLDPDDASILLTTGIAAGFGAVFGTPLTGAIFALEVLAIGRVGKATVLRGI